MIGKLNRHQPAGGLRDKLTETVEKSLGNRSGMAASDYQNLKGAHRPGQSKVIGIAKQTIRQILKPQLGTLFFNLDFGSGRDWRYPQPAKTTVSATSRPFRRDLPQDLGTARSPDPRPISWTCEGKAGPCSQGLKKAATSVTGIAGEELLSAAPLSSAAFWPPDELQELKGNILWQLPGSPPAGAVLHDCLHL